MLLIINEFNSRLCRDFKWRDHANFGSFGSCVKEYTIAGHARRHASHIRGRVVRIPAGYTISASGEVFDESGGKHSIESYVLDNVPLEV